MTDSTSKNLTRQRSVSSIDLGGRILAAFLTDGKPIKLRDLAEKTGLAAAKLHPYLVSFRNMGMVEMTDRGLYQLGPFALHLGFARLRLQDAHRMVVSRVSALSEELNLMVSVAVWAPQGPTITYIQEHSFPLNSNIQVGGVYSLPMTATGMVFCAYLPRSETAPLIAKEFADNESKRRHLFHIDDAAFKNNVKKAQKAGFATTQDMPIPGVTAVSAPVFDHTGKIQLCVAAIGPSDFMDISPDSHVVRTLLNFTETQSYDLGYQPGQTV